MFHSFRGSAFVSCAKLYLRETERHYICLHSITTPAEVVMEGSNGFLYNVSDTPICVIKVYKFIIYSTVKFPSQHNHVI